MRGGGEESKSSLRMPRLLQPPPRGFDDEEGNFHSSDSTHLKKPLGIRSFPPPPPGWPIMGRSRRRISGETKNKIDEQQLRWGSII